MGGKVKIVIDDREYEVEEGKTVLQAALENGIEIPFFCYHPRLSIAGSCRMCLVYWENIKRLVISCNTPVQEGMVIRTHRTSEAVRENQRYLLQALMTRHPLDCPVCDKAGECDLQNYGAIYGPQRQVVPISALEKEREEHDWESDFLEYHSNRCIVCYRCVRACNEVVSAHALYVEERGFHSNIVPTVRPMDTSVCEMCGICVYVCPVGAILSKPFRFWTRSWLLRRERTRCNLCPVGCEVTVEFGEGDWRSKRKVYRIMPTDDLNVCAKAFFGYDLLNRNRLLTPIAHGKEETSANMVNLLKSLLSDSSGKVAFVLSGYVPNEIVEDVVAVADAVGAYLTAPQTADFFKLAEVFGDYVPPTLEEIRDSDFFLLIGEDTTSTATVLSYYIEGKVYRIGDYVRDGKLKPQQISAEEVDGLEGRGTLVVSAHSFQGPHAKEMAERLRRWSERGHRVLLLPREGNTYGLYRRIRELYSDVEAVMGMVMGGEIETLVLIGEDLTEYYGEDMLAEILSRSEHLVVASPFSDGLAGKAAFRIPMALMGETPGSFTTLLGEVRGRSFLPWSFDDLSFWRKLRESFGETRRGIRRIRVENPTPLKPEVHLYRNSWITARSENLTRLFEKNAGVREYRI